MPLKRSFDQRVLQHPIFCKISPSGLQAASEREEYRLGNFVAMKREKRAPALFIDMKRMKKKKKIKKTIYK